MHDAVNQRLNIERAPPRYDLPKSAYRVVGLEGVKIHDPLLLLRPRRPSCDDCPMTLDDKRQIRWIPSQLFHALELERGHAINIAPVDVVPTLREKLLNHGCIVDWTLIERLQQPPKIGYSLRYYWQRPFLMDRSSLVSVARQTSPMPPAPRGASIW